MTEAVTKEELLVRLHNGYQQFQQLIAPLSFSQLQAKGVVGAWSMKDIIAHFIAHEQFALRELAAAQQGASYWNPYQDVDEMNAEAVAHYAQESVEQVLLDWEQSFRQVITAVESLAETDFVMDSSVVRHLNDTIDGALANNTYDHYAEHTPAIQAWIAQQ